MEMTKRFLVRSHERTISFRAGASNSHGGELPVVKIILDSLGPGLQFRLYSFTPIFTTAVSFRLYNGYRRKMDLSNLARIVLQLRDSHNHEILENIQEEARKIQEEISRRLQVDIDELDKKEKVIKDRWGNDPNFLKSFEWKDAVVSSASKANTGIDLLVQRAALQGMIQASQEKNVMLIQQFLGFAQNPHKTILELPDKIKPKEAPRWSTWAGIIVAAMVSQWLISR
jgi:hypothetical protein